MKLLVLTDSVALPRVKPEHTLMDETWPALLRRDGYEVIQCSIGAATSSDILKQSNYYSLSCLNVDAVLVQCGIVDCAPRFIKRWEYAVLKKIPIFGRKILRVLNKSWVRQSRNITYTTKDQFRKNINAIKKAFKNKLFFISIVPASPAYEATLKGVTKNIALYNNILKSESKVIEIAGVEQYGVMSDGHHLNRDGHIFVCNRIKKYLEDVFSK